ncbi:MAG: ATP-binding protein [Micropruina sp.]|uniref:ATP-binding protein n=1 Tax=Micropruina sp. TaxID=2737536 RepID=UPI0039E6E9AD
MAGRDQLLRDWQLMLSDLAGSGRVSARDTILVGPRGVGKTAALTAFCARSRAQGFEVINLQAVSGQGGLVSGLLHRARTRIDEGAGPWQRARAAFERLAGVDLSVAGVGAGVSFQNREPAAEGSDAGSLASALSTLAAEVRRDAQLGGALITVDELQVAAGPDLALLAAALHRLNVDQPKAPVAFAGTGLPHTLHVLRDAGVTHPDRLFDVQLLPLTLSPEDARYAVVEPARQSGVLWEPEAADLLVEVSSGYPAHLQLFADAAWRTAPGPHRITRNDVEAAIPLVAGQLERRTLGPRWDRISDRQMEFMAALALLGGQASSSHIAAALGREQREISWIREELLIEGDVYAPRRGQLHMTVPLFRSFVLGRYESVRADAETRLLSLDEMRHNLGARHLDTSRHDQQASE